MIGSNIVKSISIVIMLFIVRFGICQKHYSQEEVLLMKKVEELNTRYENLEIEYNEYRNIHNEKNFNNNNLIVDSIAKENLNYEKEIARLRRKNDSLIKKNKLIRKEEEPQLNDSKNQKDTNQLDSINIDNFNHQSKGSLYKLSKYFNPKNGFITITFLFVLLLILYFINFIKLRKLNLQKENNDEYKNAVKHLKKMIMDYAGINIYNKDLIDLLQPLELYFQKKKKSEIHKNEYSVKISSWLNNLESGQNETVLKDIFVFIKSNDMKHLMSKVTSLSTRNKFLKDQFNQGVLEHDKYLIEINKINNSLIQLIFEIENQYITLG